MSDRVRCPACGGVAEYDGERPEEPDFYCTPLRCSAWNVVGKFTQPHPLTGARRLLQVVPSEASERSGT